MWLSFVALHARLSSADVGYILRVFRHKPKPASKLNPASAKLAGSGVGVTTAVPISVPAGRLTPNTWSIVPARASLRARLVIPFAIEISNKATLFSVVEPEITCPNSVLFVTLIAKFCRSAVVPERVKANPPLWSITDEVSPPTIGNDAATSGLVARVAGGTGAKLKPAAVKADNVPVSKVTVVEPVLTGAAPAVKGNNSATATIAR